MLIIHMKVKNDQQKLENEKKVNIKLNQIWNIFFLSLLSKHNTNDYMKCVNHLHTYEYMFYKFER